MLLKLVIIGVILTLVQADCAFMVNSSDLPYVPDKKQKEGFIIIQESVCDEFLGKKGCCTHQAYKQMKKNFQTIDAVFGSSSSGCDLCAINLKRFWCTYACAHNQQDFIDVGDWAWVTSYNHPDKQVYVQQIYLTVESTTACRLFYSCKRTSFAAQLSALQSPAGFLNIQGKNAMDASQIIYVDFTDNKTQGLYIQEIDPCDVKLPTPPQKYRGFKVIKNCSCNTCQSQQCTGKNQYIPISAMQGFNYELVFWSWGVVVTSIAGLTLYRNYRDRKRRN